MMFLFDAWLSVACFLIGMLTGAVMMHLRNKDLLKKHKHQAMLFVNMITDLVIENLKLNKISQRLIAINREILLNKKDKHLP